MKENDFGDSGQQSQAKRRLFRSAFGFTTKPRLLRALGKKRAVPNPLTNESERLFEEFCRQQSVRYEPIEETTARTPDYRIFMGPTAVTVEVKEIEPSKEEKSVIDAGPESMNPEDIYHWGIPGERVRKKILNAMPQLRAAAREGEPTLLVLHDPISFWPELLDSQAVKVAMYGIETALVSPEPDPNGGATVIRRWHGQRKRLTRTQNTSLSAVGILTSGAAGIGLEVYHNWYANVPLRPTSRYEAIKHFKLASDPAMVLTDWLQTRQFDNA